MEEANEFLDLHLPLHNQIFAQQPLESKDLHRRLPPGIKYRDILCLKEKRAITNGYTIKWKNRELLIDRPNAAMRRHKVKVREHFDGQIEILFNGRRLKYQEITEKIKRKKPHHEHEHKNHRKGKYIPPADHPWRRYNPALHHNHYLEKI